MNDEVKEKLGVVASILVLLILSIIAINGYREIYDCTYNKHGIFVRGFTDVYCIEEGKH